VSATIAWCRVRVHRLSRSAARESRPDTSDRRVGRRGWESCRVHKRNSNHRRIADFRTPSHRAEQVSRFSLG
jgi:hypothetical protein